MALTNVSTWVRAAKIAAVAFLCATTLFVNSAPAVAFGMKTSAEPTDGTTQLDRIYEESEQAIKGQPRGMEAVQKKASEGLNGVQGSANAGKMKSPGDSTGASTVKDDVKDALDSVLDD